MDGGRILIVDDDSAMRRALAEVLGRGGFEVSQAADGREGIERLGRDRHDLVVSDLRMPGLGGLALLQEIRGRHAELPVILITAYGTVEDAVEAMKHGAYDFLTKPFSPQDLFQLVRRALRAPAERGTPRGGRPQGARSLITRDPAVLKVLDVAESVAGSRAPVLIEGESGTGKELLARFIHTRSNRCAKPFVAVNCAALPADLLESELFGYEKGAFTGANGRKVGKFELANGGTILLDEVSEMEIGLQAKLLRVLQEYEVDRVGGSRPVPVDVRVMATTNRRLVELVERGQFREDLYYRLSVIPLTLPPLRARQGDIALLIEHFLTRLAGERPAVIMPEAQQWLCSRPWRGNIRELENAVERAVLLARGRPIGLAEVAGTEAPTPRAPMLGLAGLTVAEVERRLILETLEHTSNNRTRAARQLGISIRTLRNKLAEYRAAGLLPAGDLDAPRRGGSPLSTLAAPGEGATA